MNVAALASAQVGIMVFKRLIEADFRRLLIFFDGDFRRGAVEAMYFANLRLDMTQ